MAVIGAPAQVAGFALAGARVYPVSSAEQARAAWQQLPGTVDVVILSDAAAEAIGAARTGGSVPLTITLPA